MGTSEARTAVTIGTFDGVHLGHQALLLRTRQLAHALGLKSVVLTFPKPPQNYLGRPKRLLMPKAKRIEALRKYVDTVVILDFPKLQKLKPREFVVRILLEDLRAAAVVVGKNFCFGRDRAGNVATLTALGEELGFAVQIQEPVTVEGEIISSTAIREALQVGNVERAKKLLGDCPRIWGRVIPGWRQGQALGFPTANLAVDPEVLLPAEGIYAARVCFRDMKREGALYIGRRPTLGGQEVSVEVHILQPHPKELELYGEELEVEVLARLREDRRFETLSELRAQIRADVEEVREFFARTLKLR